MRGIRKCGLERIHNVEFVSASNKRSKDRKRSCRDKIKYKAQTEAAQAADYLNQSRCIRYEDVYPYDCRYCSGWHVGHDDMLGTRIRHSYLVF